MKNLEQIRAKSAIDFANSPADKRGKDGGDAIKKIPPMIMTNGLLAAIAFSTEKRREGYQRAGYAAIFDAVSDHLASSDISIISSNGANDLLNKLIEADSQTLKIATAEAMEWLSYARRFVTE